MNYAYPKNISNDSIVDDIEEEIKDIIEQYENTDVVTNTLLIDTDNTDAMLVRKNNDALDILRVDTSLNQTIHNDGTTARPSVGFTGSTTSGIAYSSGLSLIQSGSERMKIASTIQPKVQIQAVDGSTASPAYSFVNSHQSGMTYVDTGLDLRAVDIGLENELYMSAVNDADTHKYVECCKELRLDDGHQLAWYRDVANSDLNSRIFCDGVANLTLSSLRGSGVVHTNAASTINNSISSSLRTSLSNTMFQSYVPITLSAGVPQINMLDSDNSNKTYTIEGNSNNILFIEQGVGYPIEIRGGASGGSFAGQVVLNPGLESAPGLCFRTSRSSAPYTVGSYDADTGIYRIGADNLGVSCGGKNVLNVQQSNVTVTATEFIHRPLTTLSTNTDFRIQCGDGISSYANLVHIDEVQATFNVPLVFPNSSTSIQNYHETSHTWALRNNSNTDDFLTVSSTIDLYLTRIGNITTLSFTSEPAGTVKAVTAYCYVQGTIDSIYRPISTFNGLMTIQFGGVYQTAAVVITNTGLIEIYMDVAHDLWSTNTVHFKRSSISWHT